MSWLGLKAQLLADTLRGVAQRLLANQAHYVELFRPKIDESRVGAAGPVLRDRTGSHRGIVDVMGHSWGTVCALQAAG